MIDNAVDYKNIIIWLQPVKEEAEETTKEEGEEKESEEEEE
jgi:hypothetical protein